uniref:dCMP deaminase n=1 Tax=Dicentrarchus labrax TaxID=13489 RepID=A0A8P4G4H7_DICLA
KQADSHIKLIQPLRSAPTEEIQYLEDYGRKSARESWSKQWHNRGERGLPERPRLFYGFSLSVSQKEQDPSTQVGACIVNKENKIVGIGHNGMPDGCDGELPWSRDAVNKLDNKYVYGEHACAHTLFAAFILDSLIPEKNYDYSLFE